jgi:hypothetical protein
MKEIFEYCNISLLNNKKFSTNTIKRHLIVCKIKINYQKEKDYENRIIKL